MKLIIRISFIFIWIGCMILAFTLFPMDHNSYGITGSWEVRFAATIRTAFIVIVSIICFYISFVRQMYIKPDADKKINQIIDAQAKAEYLDVAYVKLPPKEIDNHSSQTNKKQ